MTTSTQQDVIDWNEKEQKLPSMLNVLTILTFIGCGLSIIFSAMGYFSAQKNYDSTVDTVSKLDSMPAMVKSMMGPDPLELAKRSLDNKLPILVLGLVASALCLYGAIQMRKRLKMGFTIYLIGEILPIIAMGIFIGIGLYSTFTLAWIFLFTIGFIIMYATQLKHLK